MAGADLRKLSAQIADREVIDWSSYASSAPPAHHAAFRAIAQLTSQARSGNQAWTVKPAAADLVARALSALAAAQVILAILTLVTQPARDTGRVSPALQVATMGLYAAASACLAVAGFRDPAARALAFAYIGVAAAFAHALAPAPAAWVPGAIQPAWAAFLRLPGELTLLAGVWLFVLHFPRAERGTLPERTVRWFATAAVAVAVGGLAVHAGLELVDRNAASAISQIFGPFDRERRDSHYWTIFFVALGFAVPVAARKFRLRYVAARRQIRPFMVSLGIGFAPIAILSALGSFSSTIAHLLRDERVFPMATFAVFLGLWTLPVSTAVAALTPEALPLRWVIGRSIQYSMARSTLTAAIVVPICLAGFLLFSDPHRTIGQFLEGGGGAALSVALVSALLAGLRTRVLALVDRLFSRGRVDVRSLIMDIGSAGRRRMSARDVGEALLTAVRTACHPTSAALLIATDCGALEPLVGHAEAMPARGALKELLESCPTVLGLQDGRHEDIKGLLPALDREWVGAHCWHALTPIHGPGQVLIGAVCVGPPASGDEYHVDDYATLEALCSAAGPVLATRLTRAATTGLGPGTVGLESECRVCGQLLAGVATACRCGGPLVGSALPRVVAGRYELQRRIGAGGMGVVYQALDQSLGRRVALKALPELGPREAEQLRREARLMASLQHKGLAFVLGLETVGSSPVLVVEYLSRGTLFDRLRTDGPLDAGATVELGIALADALAYLHTHDVLHRDLKPSNVGFTEGGDAKLLDFGVAVAAKREDVHTAAGTMLYMPPEALQGAPASHACDLWSLNVLLCEAWIGHHPLSSARERDRWAILTGGHFLAEASKLFPASGGLRSVLERGLAAEAAQRYQSATELRCALLGCSQD